MEESSTPEDLMMYGRDDGRGERVEATLQGKSTSEKGERILPHEIGINNGRSIISESRESDIAQK